MSIQTNSKLAYEASTVVVALDYAGAASDPARVQLLIDLISGETMDGADQQNRLFLDEMTPIARVGLFAHLTKLKAAVT